jgi:phospholipid/cholesterol/gamma-HCH transport system permease protein
MLRTIGHQTLFYAQVYSHVPEGFTRYRREVVRHIGTVSFSQGGLALVGGTAVIVSVLTASIGVEAALQIFSQLNNIGVAILAGFVASFVDVRFATPIIAGIAMVATVGAGFTADLGAQRISEEIDALEVMAIPSIPFMITTRIIAGAIAIIPLYAVALTISFVATRVTTVYGFGQTKGIYDHYFSTFLIPSDILISFTYVIAQAAVVTSICCYYGYNATGGPAGVGVAVGRAVRASLIAVMFVFAIVAVVVYGNSDTLHLSR